MNHTFTPVDRLEYFMDPSQCILCFWYPPDELILEGSIPERIIFPDLNANYFLFKQLSENQEFTNLIDPLVFFNLLYGRFQFILNNLMYYDRIFWTLNHDLNIAMYTPRQILFVYYSLAHLIYNINGNPNGKVNVALYENKVFKRLSAVNNQCFGFYIENRQRYSIKTKSILEDGNLKQKKDKGLTLNSLEDGNFKQKKDKDLTLDSIALIYVLNSMKIDRSNGNAIAKKYGYNAHTSGEKLYQRYTHFLNEKNIIHDVSSDIQIRNRIKLLESISKDLNKTGKERADAHIKNLSGYTTKT
jgi:hypothetical protein